MPGLGRQKGGERPRHDLAPRDAAGGGTGPKLADDIPGQLERDRYRRFGHRHGVADGPGLAEVAISLAPGEPKVARQHHGRLRHAGTASEQPMCCIQALGLLHVGRPRHGSYSYYPLRLRSSTEHVRQPAIDRLNRKLPFAFRESLAPCWPTCSCTMRSTCGWHGHTRTSRGVDMPTTDWCTAGARRRPKPSWSGFNFVWPNAAWRGTRRKPRSSTARMPDAGGATPIRRSTSWGTASGRGC